MSGLTETLREEVKKSGSPLAGHSLNQTKIKWFRDGFRRMDSII